MHLRTFIAIFFSVKSSAIGYQRPVVIYAAPPPHVDHVIHAAPPYRPIYQRDDRRLPYQPRRERGRSPGIIVKYITFESIKVNSKLFGTCAVEYFYCAEAHDNI